MRRIAARSVTGLALLGTVGLGACGGATISQDEFQEELERIGIASPDAACVVEQLAQDDFAFRRYGELDDEELAQVATAGIVCLQEDGVEAG